MDELEEFEFRARAERERATPKYDKSSFANGPVKFGADAFPDSLRQTLDEAGWANRNIAGAGTALSNIKQGIQQFFGQGDQQQIANNKIIEESAPVGALAGNVALTAIPFGLVGNSIKAAGAVGAWFGALQPVAGDQTLGNIAKGKLATTAEGAAFGAAGQKLANVGGGWLSAKLAERAAQGAKNAPIDKTLRDAIEAGLVVPPSSVNPSFLTTMNEGIAGKISTAQTASNRNSSLIDAMARKAVGLPENAPLTSEAMKQVRSAAYQSGYAPIESLGKVQTDSAYIKALDSLVSARKSASNSFPNAVKDEITPIIDALKVAEFDAGDALKMTQILRDDASAAYRAGETAIGAAKKNAAKAIEDQIERSLQQQGANGADVLAGFRDARKLMAKAHTVEDAIVEGGGTVNARKLAQRVQAGKPMSDELAVIGNFANNFPRATQPAQQVAGPGVSKLNSIAALATGGGGAVVGGPMGAMVGATAPFVVPPLMRNRLLSAAAQKGLIPNYGPTVSNRLAAALLKNTPVGLTAFGVTALNE